MRRFVLSLILLAVARIVAAQSCEHWVAPSPAGNDGNAGTFAQPWATLDHASASVPDVTCTVWFKDGVYTGTHSLYERFATPTTFKAQSRYKAVLEYSGTVVKLFGAKNMILEGFEIRHTGPGAGALVMQVQQDGTSWAEDITIRDNVFHDSWNNDLLKINNGARFVTVENNVLTLTGERKQEQSTKSEQFQRIERRFGHFSRSFTLPTSVDAGQIAASYKDGVLTIRLPRREESKPKQISVSVE